MIRNRLCVTCGVSALAVSLTPCPLASNRLDGRHALDLEDEHCAWCGARCTASRSVISAEGSLAGNFVSYVCNTGLMLPFMQS